MLVGKKERKLKKSIALYFDYRVNGVRYVKPSKLHLKYGNDERTKQANKDNLLRFEILRNQLESKLLNGYVPVPVDKQKTDFYQYYEAHFVKFPTRERRAAAVLNKLKSFSKKPTLPVAQINEDFLLRFKDFLEKKLKGETPHNYFKLLSRVLHHATKDRLFETNPAADIKMRRKEGTLKNVLTIDDIKILAASECSNTAVKNAFLFCCFTGLRYCDVSRLRWQHISNSKLSITQAKTGFRVEVDLHDNAKKFMGAAGLPEQLIFDLPTTLNGCNKVLKAWVLSAGIDKKITWHCGRHTLACNLVALEVGVHVIAKNTGADFNKAYSEIHQAG